MNTPIAVFVVLLVMISLATINVVLSANAAGSGMLQDSTFSFDLGSLATEDHTVRSSEAADSLIKTLFITYTAALFLAFSYFGSCLYQDRKDRSILFWRSLPYSDTEDLLAKLFAGGVLYPCIAMLGTLLAAIASMIIIWLGALFLGAQDFVSLLVQQLAVFSPLKLLQLLISLFLLSLHLLPFFLWAMLCSAYCKRNPLLKAIFVPIAIDVATWIILQKSFLFHSASKLFQGLIGNSLALAGGEFAKVDLSIWLVGIVLSSLLFVACLWLRQHRYEI